MKTRRLPGYPLTPAEEDAVELLAYGGTDKSMAAMLEKDYLTVRDQIESAKKKLGAKTRAHLAVLWLKSKG